MQMLPSITAHCMEDMATGCGRDLIAGRVQVQTYGAADFHCAEVTSGMILVSCK